MKPPCDVLNVSYIELKEVQVRIYEFNKSKVINFILYAHVVYTKF